MRFGSRPGESVSLTRCTTRRDAIRKPQGQGIRRACRLGGGGVERAGPGAGAESGAPIRRGPGGELGRVVEQTVALLRRFERLAPLPGTPHRTPRRPRLPLPEPAAPQAPPETQRVAVRRPGGGAIRWVAGRRFGRGLSHTRLSMRLDPAEHTSTRHRPRGRRACSALSHPSLDLRFHVGEGSLCMPIAHDPVHGTVGFPTTSPKSSPRAACQERRNAAVPTPPFMLVRPG